MVCGIQLKENKRLFECLYLLALGLYVVKDSVGTTIYTIPWPTWYDNFVRTFAIGVLLLKTGFSEQKSAREWCLCLCSGAFFLLSWMSNGYWFLFDLIIYIVGAFSIPYRKILKLYFWCNLCVMGLAAAGSLTGCIRDLLYYENGMYKHSFGICYPTDFAAHLVYLLLIFWMLYENVPDFLTAGIMAAAVCFQFIFTDTKCSEIVLSLSVFGVIYVWLSSKYIKKSNGVRRIIHGIDYFMVLLMPICAGIMISLSYWYDPENFILFKMNTWFSNRLSLAQNAFNQYGFKLFGTAFDMVGNGSETVSRPGYNFVDSSYCLILVRYGIALLLALLFLYMFMCLKALKKGRKRLVVAFALIAVHSMIEHHMIELAYNPMFLLAFADLSMEERKKTVKFSKQRYIVYVVFGGIILLFSPLILSYGRTLVTLLQLNNDDRNIHFIIAFSALIVAVVMLIREMANFIVTRGKSQILSVKSVGKIVVAILAIGCSVGGTEWIFRKKISLYGDSVQRGKVLIEALRDDFTGHIYVDDIPELYRREVQGISYRILPADSAATEENTVIIADKGRDIFCLIEAGYYFGEISEREGIYTNDRKAIEILQTNGIDMKSCYSVVREVDLAEAAVRNGLSLSETGGLIIEGQDKSLIYGPYDVIYRGRLRVEYRLKLLESSIQEGELARARLSSDNGKTILEVKGITREDFDKNGYATVVIEKNINSLEGMEYLLFANGDTKMEIESIRYGKVELQK